MPELPEVETMRRELEEKVRGRTFLDVWTDTPKLIYYPLRFSNFQKEVKGRKLEWVERKGKVLIIHLSRGKILLVHPKMTGHFLIGHWRYQDRKWQPILPQQYIHLMFWLDNQQMLAWSDLRKFSRLELHSSSEIQHTPLLQKIGVDPLTREFSVKKFQEMIRGSKKPIKVWLMDQSQIGGIGNIYASEILWRARLHPQREASSLSLAELKILHYFIKTVLREALKLNGTSVADFRDLKNELGNYVARLRVYGREGNPCPRCGETIKRIKIGGRSAYYCPVCQAKL